MDDGEKPKQEIKKFNGSTQARLVPKNITSDLFNTEKEDA